MQNKTYYQAVGRRKQATAMVRLYPLAGKKTVTVYGTTIKSGDFLVNKKDASEFFPGEVYKAAYRQPFKATQSLNDFAVSVHVRGGGKRGQLDAAVHGIARALDLVDKEKYHSLLKREGLLTRDARVKERRKAGLAGKARKKKSSPKR